MHASHGDQDSSQNLLEKQLAQVAITIPPTIVSVGVKLDRSNFLLWKEQIIILIGAYRVEGFINGSKTEARKVLEGSSKPNP